MSPARIHWDSTQRRKKMKLLRNETTLEEFNTETKRNWNKQIAGSKRLKLKTLKITSKNNGRKW